MLLYWVYVLYCQVGVGVPFPPLSYLVGSSCAISCQFGLSSCLMVLSCRFLCLIRLSARMSLRVWVGVGGLTLSEDHMKRLPEEVDPRLVFPLRDLDADLMCRHPGPLYAPACGPHQSYGNPALDVSAHPGVGLPPLCCKADSYPF